MTRITNDMRAAIIAKAQEKAGCEVIEKSLQERRQKWAEEVRIFSLGGKAAARKFETLAEKLKALRVELPENVRNSQNVGRYDDDMLANVAGRRVRARWSAVNDYRLCPHEVVIEAAHPLAEKWTAIENDARDLQDKRDTIHAQVGGTLQQFHTLKKLIEAWPEVAELLPPIAANSPAARTNLPAVPVASLNTLVGLPSNKTSKKQ
jgi:hypothetical protein